MFYLKNYLSFIGLRQFLVYHKCIFEKDKMMVLNWFSEEFMAILVTVPQICDSHIPFGFFPLLSGGKLSHLCS